MGAGGESERCDPRSKDEEALASRRAGEGLQAGETVHAEPGRQET